MKPRSPDAFVLLLFAGLFPWLPMSSWAVLGHNNGERDTAGFLRKEDFPTLFYPKDNKFVTLAPHEVPVSSISSAFRPQRGRANESPDAPVVATFSPQRPLVGPPQHDARRRPHGPSAPSSGRRPHFAPLGKPHAPKALRPFPVGHLPLGAIVRPPTGEPHQAQPPSPTNDGHHQEPFLQPEPPQPSFRRPHLLPPQHPRTADSGPFSGVVPFDDDEDEAEQLFTPPPRPPSAAAGHRPVVVVSAFPPRPHSSPPAPPALPLPPPPPPVTRRPVFPVFEPLRSFGHEPPRRPHSPSSAPRRPQPPPPPVSLPSAPQLPTTAFSCRNHQLPGYYADVEAQCKTFHVCYEQRQFTFFCPSGTLFDQRYLVCSWWYGVDCDRSPSFFPTFSNNNNNNKRSVAADIFSTLGIWTNQDEKSL